MERATGNAHLLHPFDHWTELLHATQSAVLLLVFLLLLARMRILGAMLGWQTYPAYGRHAYIVQESVGAYLAILAIAIWRGRRHFSQTVKVAFEAPTSYRMAWAGIICGLGILTFFGYRAGMSPDVSVTFFLFFYALSIAITRLRAEVGFPDHDVRGTDPDDNVIGGDS